MCVRANIPCRFTIIDYAEKDAKLVPAGDVEELLNDLRDWGEDAEEEVRRDGNPSQAVSQVLAQLERKQDNIQLFLTLHGRRAWLKAEGELAKILLQLDREQSAS
jgi:hypothetical protein